MIPRSRNASPYAAAFRQNIEQYGRAVMGVSAECGPECLGNHLGHHPSAGPDKSFIPFCYTIGNFEKNLPELLLIFRPDLNDVLNIMSDIMIRQDRPFEHGELVDIGGKVPSMVIYADHRAKDYTLQVTHYYGTPLYAVQQVLVPDPQGRYPHQPGCRHPYSRQPVLGVTPVPVFSSRS
jgi:hypothetical protein